VLGIRLGARLARLRCDGEQAPAEVQPSGPGLLGLKIAPHDLRRTHAKLAYNGGSRLEQIQLALGHSSVQTTERYLGTEQDFGDAPCDRLGILSVNPKA
jgi:integrase